MNRNRVNEIKIFYSTATRTDFQYSILFFFKQKQLLEITNDLIKFHVKFLHLFVRYSPTNNFITTRCWCNSNIFHEIFPQLWYVPTTRPNNKSEVEGGISPAVLWHPVLNIVNELCYSWTRPSLTFPLPLT